MTKTKRIISILLSLVMLLSITAGLNLTAFAGRGPDKVYHSGDYVYFYPYGEETEEIIIDEYNGNASNLTIPSTLDGKKVVGINYGAFSYTNSLKSVTIPSSITRIGDRAFGCCENLTGVTLPDSVISIGRTAFDDTGYFKDKSNWDNGVFYVGNHLISSDGTTAGSYTIKKGTVTIQDNAFSNCSNLTDIIIPESVKVIGRSAFYELENLKNVTMKNGLISIEENAFYDCNKLKSITIPNSVADIGKTAFCSCGSLESITISDKIKSLGRDCFRGTAFYYDEKNWENGVLYCGNYLIAAYNYNFSLDQSAPTNYTVKSGTKIIAGGAFDDCKSLTSVTIPNSVTSIGDYAFNSCVRLSSVTIPNSVTSIGSSAFNGCTSLTSVTISNSVTEIENYAFSGCTSLTNVTIPNSVTSIGISAFADCTSLTSITIPNSVTSIGYGAFEGCTSLTNVTIPNSVTSIGSSAFADCTSLTNVTIPNSVTSIGSSAFNGCTSLKSININSANKNYSSQNGILFDKNKKELIKYPAGKADKSYTIPNSVTSIDYNAFEDCKSLTSVTIPNSVTEIGIDAFYNTGIYNNKSNWNDGVLYISNCLIRADSDTLKGNYTIKSGTRLIADYAFCDCKNLTGVTIPNSVTKIGDTVFSNCKSLTSVTIYGINVEIESFAISENTTIHGYKGSTAEAYAKYYNNKFVALKCSHTWNGGKVTKKATCTANGVKTYTCTVCGETKTETIKATGHKAVTDKAVAATCTKAGKTAGSHCSVCNAVITAQKTVPATGHSYDAGKVTKAPTATTTGVKTYTCTKCKATKTETIKATGLKTPVLTATVNANGTFTLSWNKVTGAEKYELYIKQADGSYKLMKTTTATSFTTAFATYGKQFTYKMRAVTSKNSSATSAYSSAVNAINNKKLQTPTLKVAVNANGTFKLSWNKVTGAEKYELYIKQADGSYKLMKTTTATSFTTAFATYGKQFSYKMRAITSKNKNAASAYSSVVNAKNTKKLQTPTLKAAVNKNGSFKLSWGKVTGAEKYELYIKQTNGSYKLMKTTTGTSFTTAVASKGKTYSYKVRAVTGKNKNAASNYSNAVNAKRK